VIEHTAETDTSWLLEAACRGSDPELFFPSRGENRQLSKAKAICNECPVQPECLQYAVDNQIHQGIYGGQSERQRRNTRRTANAQQRQQEISGL
jgi:WhiB family redox-sensing transcriptional regulator